MLPLVALIPQTNIPHPPCRSEGGEGATRTCGRVKSCVHVCPLISLHGDVDETSASSWSSFVWVLCNLALQRVVIHFALVRVSVKYQIRKSCLITMAWRSSLIECQICISSFLSFVGKVIIILSFIARVDNLRFLRIVENHRSSALVCVVSSRIFNAVVRKVFSFVKKDDSRPTRRWRKNWYSHL